MERREILKVSALFLGYSLVGGSAIAVMNGCKADTSVGWQPVFFTQDQAELLAEVAERIIPTTDTPGAKSAMVDRYIDEAVHNNYKPEDQKKFQKSIGIFNDLANEKFKKSFVKITDSQKDEVLNELAKAAKNANDDQGRHVFHEMRSLVVSGYFTSEIGATQALVYDPIPGPYQACIPLSDVGGTYSL